MLNQRDISNFCIPAHDGELQITKHQTLGCAKQKDERQLSYWKFQLAMKKKFFTVVKHCNRLPGEAVEFPSLEVFET